MSMQFFPAAVRSRYEVHEWKHACAVLRSDFPAEWDDITAVLGDFRLRRSQILTPGGGKSPISQWFDAAFKQRGWVEKGFETKIVVDENEMLSPTHKVDCVKSKIAIELEWSNKDPFFDRDLGESALFLGLWPVSMRSPCPVPARPARLDRFERGAKERPDGSTDHHGRHVRRYLRLLCGKHLPLPPR